MEITFEKEIKEDTKAILNFFRKFILSTEITSLTISILIIIGYYVGKIIGFPLFVIREGLFYKSYELESYLELFKISSSLLNYAKLRHLEFSTNYFTTFFELTFTGFSFLVLSLIFLLIAVCPFVLLEIHLNY